MRITDEQQAFFDDLRLLCAKYNVVIGGSVGDDAPWIIFASMPNLVFGGLWATRDMVSVYGKIVSRLEHDPDLDREFSHHHNWEQVQWRLENERIGKRANRDGRNDGGD